MVQSIKIGINTDDVEEQFLFQNTQKSTNEFWADNGNIKLLVEVDSESGGKKIKMLHCAERLLAYQDLIKGTFAARYDEYLQKRQENYESGLENDEDLENDYEISVPYNPQLITVAPAKFSLKEIVSMIDGDEDEEPTLDLSPDYQREYVWDNIRKSRLIESILLNIPLPVFYLARDKSGKLQVVDGVQRLTTIYKYFKNEFKLGGLEYLGKECEGKYFRKPGISEDKNLHPKLMRALRQYQIDCNIIEPSTPENVKLDIFKRLNTGGKSLNKQEVRHAFMKKNVRDLLKELVDSKEFREATDFSISDNRMMAQELILRYIGFYSLYNKAFLNVEYSGKMDEFLDDVAVKLNECKKIPCAKITNNFKKSMRCAKVMFGEQAFRKLEAEEKKQRNPINKSLFVAFSVLLNLYSEDEISKKKSVEQQFRNYLKMNPDYYQAISHNTNYLLKEITIPQTMNFLDSVYHEGVRYD